MVKVVSGLLGVGIADTPTSNATGHVLGTQVLGDDGTKYVYVQASGAITQYDCVAIDEAFQAAAITKALADDGHKIGFAQVAFADNDYGWVATEGTVQVRYLTLCAADVALYTSATAGVLDDTSTSQTKIVGLVNTVVVGGSTAASESIAVNPHIVLA